MKAHQRAARVIIELACLVPGRQAHRDDEFRGLLRCVEGLGILAGKYSGAHPGADRSRAEQVDAERSGGGLVRPRPHQRIELRFLSAIRSAIGICLSRGTRGDEYRAAGIGVLQHVLH